MGRFSIKFDYYPVLSPLVEMVVEEIGGTELGDLSGSFDTGVVEKVVRLVNRNEFFSCSWATFNSQSIRRSKRERYRDCTVSYCLPTKGEKSELKIQICATTS